MTAATVLVPLSQAGAARAGLARLVTRLRLTILWCTGLAGAFVFIEPSPYEFVVLVTMGVFALTGLALRAAHMPLFLLLVLYNLGLSISLVPVIGAKDTLMWVLVSWYLAATALFFAVILTQDPKQLQALASGCIAAGLIAATAGIVGYFHLVPGAGMFTRYERAQGTFNDPNVMGAFLIFPACLLIHRVLTGRGRQVVLSLAMLAVLLAGIFLSFSRGAWGHLIFSAGLVVALTWMTSAGQRERLRILGWILAGLVALGVLIVALLSVDKVADLFLQRASLTQSYDEGHRGRFGRMILGAMMMLDRPFGLGPLQFGRYFPEAPHNVYLNAFVSGGWLAGLSYFALVVGTLALGARALRRDTPFRPMLIVAFATFLGVVLEGFIIDTDHWRHFYLLLGVVWGLSVAALTREPGPAVARVGSQP
jgi:hypothetical protein